MEVAMTKFVRRMMVPIVGALVLCSGASALASTTVWKVNGSPVLSSHAVSAKGSIELEMTGSVRNDIKCEDTQKGSVSAKGAGEITSFTITSCVNKSECPAPSTIEVLHLPWHTELTTVEGNVIDQLVGTKGFAGPVVRLNCTIQEQPEECLMPSFTLTNTSPSVAAKFEGKLVTCAFNKDPYMTSKQTITLVEGGVLSVATE
jgi:hypothetical protein